MSISAETPDATDARLRRVIRSARLTVYDQPFAFEEFAIAELAARARSDAVAVVRDDAVWSQLAPTTSASGERFCLWRFHFPDGVDNSGFVGWLASHLKDRFGTGVIVVCGCNSADGGVFDYWGCPESLRREVLGEVRALVDGPASGPARDRR
ncbi:MAG: DUF6196 family protein [Dermatophilaceae bacterium]